MKTGSANALRVSEPSLDNRPHLEGRSNSLGHSVDIGLTSSSLVDTIRRRSGCEYVATEGILGKQSRGNEAPPHREENGDGSDPGWEGFLQQRQLSVLLVENDSSTRHVVAALLRNCSYGVYTACNGLEAWEHLNDPANHFDLLLTEVVTPSLSGIGLLYKIMTHKAYKHIPVIMMSAQDSVGIVLKCLSKGAADFLVKPLRKNELKNLWQHVWRRSHSSSGSGCETQNVPQPKSGSTASGNNTGSNDESDNITLNVMDGSDNGSGTQSSWTKRAFRIESPLYRCVKEKPIGSHMEDPQRNQASVTVVIAEGRAIQREIETDTSQDLDIATRKVAHYELLNARDKTSPETSFECALKHNVSSTRSREKGQTYEHANGCQGHSMIAIDLVHSIACNNKETLEENGDSGSSIAKNKETHEEKGVSGCNSNSSFLNLILKRPCARHLQGGVEERQILRHSGSSAFSRYNAPNNFNLPLSGACSNNIHPLPLGYGNDEMGNNDFNQSGFNEHVKPKLTNPQTHHSHHHHHHHHHHSYDYLHHQHQSKSSDASKPQREEQSTITMDICGSGPQSNSSSTVNVSEGGNNGQMGSSNGCVIIGNGNESITGSFNGNDGYNNGHRNDQNHHLTSLTSVRIIADSSQNVNVGAPPLGSIEAEQSRVATREATLNKFRQKRKNRCYEKKVRYQSRKQLAEQRPRVRGQFVRQNVYSCEQE